MSSRRHRRRQEDGAASINEWLRWIGANAVAWTLGFGLAQVYARLLYSSDSYIERSLREASYIWTRPLESPVATMNFGLMIGVVVGLGQWLVLRRKLDIKWTWWLAATTLGFAAHGLLVGLDVQIVSGGEILTEGIDQATALGSLGLLCGSVVLVSVPQWLVLRRSLNRTGWWIVASSIGLLLAILDRSGGTDSLAPWVFVSMIAGSVYGLATAVALYGLARPKKDADEGEPPAGDATQETTK